MASEAKSAATTPQPQPQPPATNKIVPPPPPPEVEHVTFENRNHIPDLLWLEKTRDPRHSSEDFVCAFRECQEQCSVGSACHCVLCPLYPQKKGASFYYCDEHLRINSIYAHMGADDGEAVCQTHVADFNELVRLNRRKHVDGKHVSEEDRQLPLYRKLRLWRWDHYGPHTLKK